MKWQQRVRVATGLSCWQIMLHLLVVAVLVMGWISGALVRVGLGLCVLYSVTLLAMLFYSVTMRRAGAMWETSLRSSPRLVLRRGHDSAVAAVARAAQQPAAGPRRAGDTGRPGGGLAAGER